MSRTSYLRRPLAALLMAAALAASVVMAVVVLASPAWAATSTVTNNADSGEGSLRQAIIDADTTTGVADTINFDLGSAASIPLTSAQLPTITDGAGLTIDGGSANIEINGQNTYRVFEVGNGAKLTLSNLTVVHGAPDGNGGAISNSGGTLEVSNSTLSDNYPFGGGGAIFNDSGTVTVSNSKISNNSAGRFGGGIANSNGTLEVSNSTLYGNSASSFFCCSGGGGIYNDGTATVSNSTLSSNGAGHFGGAISNSRGTLEVNNSTLYGNSAYDEFAFGAGGIDNDGGTATFKNTIVATSPSASGQNCSGFEISNGGYNLDSDNTCGFSTNNNSLSGVDPMLGDLAANGGPTMTHALLEGSPAIDQGNSFGATTDQRGKPRPFDFDASSIAPGDGSDIGAFERQQNEAPVANDDSFTTDEDTPLNVAASEGVLGNDTDLDGDTLSATQVAGPTHGTLTFNDDGSFSYTPTSTFHGSDSFTYMASDGTAYGNVATVSIRVNAVTPVAVDIKPTTCPNSVSPSDTATYPVALLGTGSFGLSEVVRESVELEGVPAQTGRKVTRKDVATPYSGTITDPPQANQCTTAGPDGQTDLNLKFDGKSLLEKLGAVTNKEVRVLTLTGELEDGTPIKGKDVVIINKMK